MIHSFSDPHTILIAEDEPLVRRCAVSLFESDGFEVIDVRNATEALAALKDRPDIEALFTDVEMPGGINGFLLAQSARISHPHLAVMIVSGRDSHGRGLLPKDAYFAMKPYDGPAMVHHIRQMMASA